MKNICDWENCSEVANFKAPVEKDNNKKFRWLCLEHIKIFNKKWNYFSGMSQNEIEEFVKSDSTWHRPTQKFSSADNFFNILWNHALNNDQKFFKENLNGKNFSTNLTTKGKEALNLLGLKTTVTWEIIQKKFKTLVKKYHPDMNSGNKIYEEKLKSLTLAYTYLKKHYEKRIK